MKTYLGPSAARLSFILLATFICVALTARVSIAADAPLAAGAAKGTFTVEGQTANLTNAAAFVDVKDDEKPTILILSDRKLPTEEWTSEFDLIRAGSKLEFTGVIFFINKAGEPFRYSVYSKGRQASVSGYFKLKLDEKTGKSLTGTAFTEKDNEDKYKLAVSFHAELK